MEMYFESNLTCQIAVWNNNTRHEINKGDINVSRQDLQVIKLTTPFSKTDQKGLSTIIAVCAFNQTAI
jgi:hypothetical protein